LPSANITPLPLDGATLRASLSAIQTALEREDAFQQLQQSYQVLQDRFDVANRRITELDADFAHTAQLAAPYVQFCQNRYESARHDLQAAQRQYQEVVEALADREGDAARIRSLERQIARDQQQHVTAIATRDRLISDLQRQLTAALLQPPALASSQQELQRQLDVETACHARVNVELVRVENDREQL
jgi:chromosome segregation ATPase